MSVRKQLDQRACGHAIERREAAPIGDKDVLRRCADAQLEKVTQQRVPHRRGSDAVRTCLTSRVAEDQLREEVDTLAVHDAGEFREGSRRHRCHLDCARRSRTNAGASFDDHADVAQRAHESARGEPRRLRHHQSVDTCFRCRADPALYTDVAIVAAGDRDLCATALRSRDRDIVDLERRGRGFQPYGPGLPCAARRDHDVNEILIERQRRHTRRVGGMEVARQPAVRNRLRLECAIVADDVSRYAADAGIRDLPGECPHGTVAVTVEVPA